ncbi:MAG TPA: hypothetical protein VI306_05680 [Pyrinomonadaceae bacterium]
MSALPDIPSLMPARNFNALSLRDLLEAREAAHVHLARKDGVVGTAVGRYLIRRNDPNSKDAYAVFPGDKDELGPRRLDNSVIAPWSWPCVLVFVKSWRKQADFRNDPKNFISPSIDLPDGREVPVCVVEATPDTAAARPMQPNTQSDSGCYSGGLPVFSEVQQFDRFGTIGCLVTDGKAVFALTAAHVAGEEGTPAKAPLNGTLNKIGNGDRCQVARLPFEQVYPTLPGKYVESCLDAGLIRLDSVRNWTGAVHGIGPVGELFSIDMNTLSLSLVGTPLRAHGAGSGAIEGQILALFYRYQALGGYDYVADLLIGPREGGPEFRTRAGDSGSVFFYDHISAAARASASSARGKARAEGRSANEADEAGNKAYAQVVKDFAAAEQRREAPPWRPLAFQWGGQRFFGAPAAEEGGSFPFALATSLSTACRALGVEIVRSWDIALPEYWGEVGHFTIGETACDLLDETVSEKLRKLFLNNRRNIGFDDDMISSGGHVTGLGPGGFVPLANVPDDVWKKGGTGVKRVKDNPNHYADMDEKGHDGKTLFQKCADPNNIKVSVWLDHYNGIGTPENKQGSLPFRVRQIFEKMVDYVREGKVNEYVCASGIIAHYVGDACQPLHGSRLANEHNVHSPYETTMLNQNRGGESGLIIAIRNGIDGRKAQGNIQNGVDAARRLIGLMEKTRSILSPEHIVEVWDQVGGPSAPNYKKMWEELGEATGGCMAEGALLLASLWQSAWILGGGDQTIGSYAELDYVNDLRKLFEPNGTGNQPAFLPSLWLREYPY